MHQANLRIKISMSCDFCYSLSWWKQFPCLRTVKCNWFFLVFATSNIYEVKSRLGTLQHQSGGLPVISLCYQLCPTLTFSTDNGFRFCVAGGICIVRDLYAVGVPDIAPFLVHAFSLRLVCSK